MRPLAWNNACLVDNPFLSTPPRLRTEEEIIWAGMPQQKERIEQRLRSSIETSPYSLVLNWGPWGGGKTHAARYFSQDHVLQKLSEEFGMPAPLSIIVNIPRGAKNIVAELYISIIDKLGISKIGTILSKISEKVGDDFPDIVHGYVNNEELASALLLLANPGQLSTLEREEVLFLLKIYFLRNASPSEIKKLRLGRGIENSNDMIATLTSLFNLFLYSRDDIDPQYCEMIIWFDEMEELLSLPGKEQYTLTGLIRDFTDLVPRNLTMFINFTPRAGGEFEDLGIYLGDAVQDRVRDQIFFGTLSEEEIEQYVTELMNKPRFRPENLQCPDKIYPFSHEALKYICKELKPNATPRRINEVFSLILERAHGEEIVNSDYASRIDVKFVQGMLGEIQSITSRGKIFK